MHSDYLKKILKDFPYRKLKAIQYDNEMFIGTEFIHDLILE